MDSKWIEKINALMRKAEDPATPEAERANIVDKVTYLMAKYGIEQDMIRAQEKTEPLQVNHRRINIHGEYFDKKAAMLHAVALAFGCQTVRSDGKVSVFGTDADVERTFMLFYSLIIQMDTALVIADREDRPKGQHRRTFNNSFIAGYVLTVSKRIREAAARAKEDLKRETSGNGMELVLLNKATLVQNLVKDVYPRLRSARTSWSTTSSAGYGSGRAAGERADIGGSRVSAQHASRRAISG